MISLLSKKKNDKLNNRKGIITSFQVGVWSYISSYWYSKCKDTPADFNSLAKLEVNFVALSCWIKDTEIAELISDKGKS